MNYKYILYRFATHIYTSARMYDRSYCLLDMCRKDNDIDDNDLCIKILESELLSKNHEKPIIFSVNNELVFSWITTPEHFFLLGPTRFSSMKKETDFDKLSSEEPPIRLKHNIDIEEPDTKEYLELIPPCTLNILADDTAIIYNTDRDDKGSFCNMQAVIEDNCLPDDNPEETIVTLHETIFKNVENSFAHNPYNHEKLEVNYVKNGDVEGLKTLLAERFPGRYGTLSDDPIRQEIYLGIVAITLASRAAISSGLHPETAFYLSDISIKGLDDCHDANEIIRRTVDAEIHYAQLVRDIINEQPDEPAEENPHISRCKDYIFTHMHGKITVQEIAAAIGLESNYLSALFKRCEKKTLKQFITEEKVRLIKNLLTYSSYSYIEIATYLGFSSQSHMGMEFKRITGMTPGEYRSKFVREDFIKDSLFTEDS